MKIGIIRTLTGANIYSHHPAVLMYLNLGEMKGKRCSEIAGFKERLLEALPRLNEHFCDSHHAGGFIERMDRGTHLNHAIEHTALELMALAGLADRSEKKCTGDEKDDSKAVIETTKVETVRYLMPEAAGIVEDLIKERSVVIEEKVIRAKEIAADTALGPSTQAIVDAAEKRGIPWSRENDRSLVQLGYGKNLHQVQAAITDRTAVLGVDLAGDKDMTKQRLRKFSIPVPDGEVVRTEEEALAAFERMTPPVALKPLDGRQGKGVSLNLSSPREVAGAFRIARKYSTRAVIEEMLEGKNYRVLVIGGKMEAASERLPCHVVGDGVHTVEELIEIENRNPLRGSGHEKPLTKIQIDPVVLAAMEKEGRSLSDIPDAGEKVMLCAGMNLSTGGTARDVTDEVHPSIKSMCERAARIVDIDVCGVDLVVEDISAPVPKQKGGIIELNAAPGLRMHLFPTEGKPRPAGEAIVEMLYPGGASGRIPIISITGTNGKTTVTRMVSHILASGERTVGTTTTDGIFLNGERIVRGDTTGPVSAQTILGDKAVDIAVLETARGGIARRGLGYDWSDVSVITNISEDHLGQDGIESIDDLINIKALIAERVRPGGTLVLNADDDTSDRVLDRPRVRETPKRIIYFALSENNPRIQKHLSNGGAAYFKKGDLIIESIGSTRHALMRVDSIPVTMGGTADYQVANSLAAIAACRAAGCTAADAHRLETFRSDEHNPGRTNLYRVGAGHVLIDYGHNTRAFEAVCRMAARWANKNVTGIIGVPGDRDDRIIESAARAAAHGFDRIIIKEDHDLRGRESGEVARILCETVGRETPGKPCEIVLDEIAALEAAISKMGPSDVVVLFYDKLEPVLKVLERYKAVAVPDLTQAPAAAAQAEL